MHNARIKNIPACPEDIASAIQLLKDSNCPEEIASTYLGDVTWDQKKGTNTITHHALLLGDKTLFETVTSQSRFYFADGTFGCTPRQARNVSIRGSQVNFLSYYYHSI